MSFFCACAGNLQPQKQSLEDAYKGFGRIELDYGAYQFAGDLAVYGDRSSFNVEVFSFGNLILKLEENDGEYKMYYMNRELDVEDGYISFLPLRAQDMKDVVSYFVRTGRSAAPNVKGVLINTESETEHQILILSKPDKGSIRIYLNKQI